MQVLSKYPALYVAFYFMAVVLIGCAKTPSISPFPDSSHIFPPVCSEGEQRCRVNQLDKCIGGQFHTIRSCEDSCDPIEGCVGSSSGIDSFIWIANSGEGTLSKVNTRTAEEEARYLTCSYGNYRCDPSRTSVNLHGDAVVTNRGRDMFFDYILYSSITKFAAHIDDCVDRNGNGTIETSASPTDVKPWGDDECMLWSTELPHEIDFGNTPHHAARATAWDGQEDEEAGVGGHVWVGTCVSILEAVTAYKIDGDTGFVLDQLQVPNVTCAYGGAVDSDGGFWFLGLFSKTITRVDMDTLRWETHSTSCGYGITVDSKGRIWTGGSTHNGMFESCVARYDPQTDTEFIVDIPRNNDIPEDSPRLRGIAVGLERSAGYVWAAETWGRLYQIDEETLEIVGVHSIGSDIDMIGVGVDFKGYVWTVARGTMKAYKFDPNMHEFLSVDIGYLPYTYSDMTGTQLRNAVIVR